MIKFAVLFAAHIAVLSAAIFHSDLRYGGKVGNMQRNEWSMANRQSSQAAAQQPLSDFYNDLYLVNITVGTPPQKFSLILDSVINFIWVIDANCALRMCTGGIAAGYTKNQFNSTKSQSYQTVIDQLAVLVLNWGAVGGQLGIDTVQASGFTLDSQSMLVVSAFDREEVGAFAYMPADGAFGIGTPSQDDYIAEEGLLSPLFNILPQLDLPYITVWFDRKDRTLGSVGGMLTYGGYDSVHCDSEVLWSEQKSNNRRELFEPDNFSIWLLELSALSVGNSTNLLNESLQAYIDTFTAYLTMPRRYADEIAKAYGGWSDEVYSFFSYLVHCSARDTAPPITVTLGGVSITIFANDIVNDENIGNGICELKIYGNSKAAIAFGIPLLRASCVTFDLEQIKVGFAAANHQ